MKENFKELLKSYQDIINSELIKSTNPTMPRLVYEPVDYFLKLPGKRIRPLIAMITAENYSSSYHKAMPAALAIEILHDFTLVHDDVMDDDSFRRGFKTVHNKWDIGTAILSGDAMVAIAYQKLLETKSMHLEKMIRLFTDGMYIVCAGQALDKEFETESNISYERYMEMISQKTARLISLPFELGYLAVTKELPYLAKLNELGKKIGLAFQIQDDLLDFVADKEKLGKDIGSDWRQKKKTFITINYKRLAKDINNLPTNLFEVENFDKVLEVLEKSGTFDLAKSTIKQMLDESEKISNEVEFNHPVLQGLLTFLADRNY